jgi:hypothetical protein
MLKKSCLALLALSALVFAAPSFAQNEIKNHQPVVGSLNKTETHIQAKMTGNFHKGLIDADQLSQFQRDFDGILDHENELQTGTGMNADGKKSILKDLAAFEARLDKAAALNGGGKKKSK